MNAQFMAALRQIVEEKNIPYEALLDTVRAALESAYRKRYGAAGQIRIDVNEEQGTFKVFALRRVVEKVENPQTEISLEDAREIRPDALLGDTVEVEITPSDFGRIAAQTAKQVVVQRIREAEREIIYDEFDARRDEVVTCEVQRRDNGNVYVTVGRVEALLPMREQIPTERPYAVHRRLKVYILDVRRTTKSPQVIVSRTHPGLVRRLFELEVPEVYDGIVEIVAVEREPGYRAKIAVRSHDEKVDPVGACVGHRGSRVQAVVDELAGEKIDIVRYDDDIEQYMRNALNPATVTKIETNEEKKEAIVVVPEDQLSLAIGKKGQNVRLASRLTGWKIDIMSEQEYEEHLRQRELARDPSEIKMRVYDLAQELGLTSKEAIDLLNELGIEVSSHASTVNGLQADELRRYLGGEEAMLYRDWHKVRPLTPEEFRAARQRQRLPEQFTAEQAEAILVGKTSKPQSEQEEEPAQNVEAPAEEAAAGEAEQAEEQQPAAPEEPAGEEPSAEQEPEPSAAELEQKEPRPEEQEAS